MTKDMTRGTPWKLIVQFALPIMAGNLLQQLYNTADTIIVGNFNSQQALSAVGSCASLTALFTALAIGFSIGAGVLISQYFGANRLEDLRRYASSSIVLMLALGLLMSVLGFCSAELFLEKFLGTPQSLLPQATLYFKIYAVGLVFQFGYNIAAAILRALGDSRATLYFLLVSSVLNVVLDLLFVAGFHMGVAGAAIATVFSQLASCVVGFSYMRRRYELFCPRAAAQPDCRGAGASDRRADGAAAVDCLVRLPVSAEARQSLRREHDRVVYRCQPDGKHPDDSDHRHPEHDGNLRRAEHGRAPAGARVKRTWAGRAGVAASDGGALPLSAARAQIYRRCVQAG